MKSEKAQAQRAEDGVRVLHHAAGLRPDRDAPAAQVGERADRRVRPHDEEQRAGVHRRRHARYRSGARNGGSPFLARPIQFDAMKPNSISPACSRLAFSTLAELMSSTSTGASAADALEDRLERLALAVEGAVALGGADPDGHDGLAVAKNRPHDIRGTIVADWPIGSSARRARPEPSFMLRLQAADPLRPCGLNHYSIHGVSGFMLDCVQAAFM